MLDNIPVDTQMDTIKKFMMLSYGSRQTQPPSRILTYEADLSWDVKSIICLVDDDTETLKVQEQEFVVSPLIQQCNMSFAIGSCDGLLCFYGLNETSVNNILVIWNPFIRKSFGVAVAFKDNSVFSFEGAYDSIPNNNGEFTKIHMLVSFDLITNEFKVVDLPDTLTNEVISPGGLVMGVSISELRGSLVVYGPISVEGADCCGVWVMERDRSFTKLYTILARVSKILGEW
ncbi:hypothetical protein Tco_0829414 [Tanacetum coccineum]